MSSSLPATGAIPRTVLPLPHLHGVAVAIALRGGPRYEGPRDAGLTHFLEHMLFRGAGDYETTGELMAAFERVGGEPEAYTSEDTITILLELDPERLVEGVQLLAEVLLRPRYGELEAERGLILEERLERVDVDGHPAELEDLALGLAFGGHPAGRLILGRKKTIESVTQPQLESWRARLVQRGNVAVAISGPVTPAQVDAALAPLEAIPAGDPLPEGDPLPPANGPRTAFHGAEGPQTELRFSFRAPGERDPSFPALRVLLDLLDGGPTSRLPQRLVDSGLAYNARAELVSFPDGSLVGLELSVAHNKVSQALEALHELVDGLCEEIEPAELERAELRRAQRARQSKDDVRGGAEWAARRLLFGLSSDALAEREAESQVSEAELRALALEVFHPEALTVAGICPAPAQRRQVKRALADW